MVGYKITLPIQIIELMAIFMDSLFALANNRRLSASLSYYAEMGLRLADEGA